MSTESPPTLDPRRQAAFGERLTDVLNQGAVALMLSIGHRTGLFDVMAQLPPATSAAIAREAGLDERYVREWLGAMVTGGIVDLGPADGTYFLPAEHASLLTRAARPHNQAAFAQWIPLLGSVENEIVSCFERGGGVPYAAYPRFHAVMAEMSDQTVVSSLIELILPLAPGSGEQLARGIDVLDVGCGSGRAIHRMARVYPRSRFTGYDLSPEAIAHAKREAEEQGIGNVQFEVRDLAEFEAHESFDLVTAFDTIHDQADPERVLDGIHDGLRPGGVFLMQEIGGTSHVHEDVEHPLGAFLYTVSCMHCMTVSLSAGGAGLGAMWGRETAQAMLEGAGFVGIEQTTLAHDTMNQYFVARREG